jgi:hypothetical protein
MRSELVFQALAQVPNPFQLCQLASKASRGFYRTTMVSSPQAINQAFEMVAQKQPEPEFSTVEAAVLVDLAA